MPVLDAQSIKINTQGLGGKLQKTRDPEPVQCKDFSLSVWAFYERHLTSLKDERNEVYFCLIQLLSSINIKVHWIMVGHFTQNEDFLSYVCKSVKY